MYSDLEMVCISPLRSIRDAMRLIDRNSKGIVLVVDDRRRLMGTVTDGDIRRAMLVSLDISLPVQVLLDNGDCRPNPSSTTALAGTSESELLALMNRDLLRQIPLLDEQGRVVDLVTLNDLAQDLDSPVKAVVMAGGHGHRLRPLTETVPKPMLPVGDRPMMELIINQLREVGFRQVHVTTHYKAEIIKQHFGDGRDHGVEIKYLGEDEPLGTAGALCSLGRSDGPVLVVNGDILTTVDFRAMWDFHHDHAADMTVAVKQHETRIPYGVVETSGVDIMGISEKPVVRHFVNAGIYVLSPEVCALIPEGRRYDITDLITQLITKRYRVISFPVREYWQDIGRIEDYERALADFQKGEI